MLWVTKNFDQAFSRFADYKASSAITSVESELLTEINRQLTEDILRKHTLHPTSIVSKTGSDPYDDLF